jgi:hypothetical protein
MDGLPASVVSYVPADSTRPEGRGVLGIVAAPPIGTGVADDRTSGLQVTVASSRGAATIPTSLVVETQDIYEPNERTPADLGVVTSRFDAVGLSFDALTPTQQAVPIDWYTFATETPGDWTVTLRTPAPWLAQMTAVLIPGDLDAPFIDFPTEGRWWWDLEGHASSMVGSASACRGFAGATSPDYSGWVNTLGIYATDGDLRLTIPDLPAGQHNLIVAYSTLGILSAGPWGPFADLDAGLYQNVLEVEPQRLQFSPLRYDLTIEPGLTGGPTPDAYEGNDLCQQAPTVFSFTFGDTVATLAANSDSRWDFDWYRIETDAAGRMLLEVSDQSAEDPGQIVLLRPHAAAPDAPLDSMHLEAYFDGEQLFSERDYLPGVNLVPEAGPYYLLVLPGPEPGAYELTTTWTGAPRRCDPTECTPTIAVAVPSGPAGSSVTITGTDLQRPGYLTQVLVGGNPVGNVTSASPTAVTAQMPTLSVGAYDLTVSVGGISSNVDTWTQTTAFDETAAEPNNALGEETPVAGSFAFTGGVGPTDFVDLYTFTVSRTGAEMQLTLAWGNASDLDVMIYPRGAAEPGSFGADVCGFNAASFAQPEQARCVLGDPGEYTMEVLYYSGSGPTDYTVLGTFTDPLSDPPPTATLRSAARHRPSTPGEVRTRRPVKTPLR